MGKGVELGCSTFSCIFLGPLLPSSSYSLSILRLLQGSWSWQVSKPWLICPTQGVSSLEGVYSGWFTVRFLRGPPHSLLQPRAPGTRTPPSWVDSHKVSSTRLSFQHPLAHRTLVHFGTTRVGVCAIGRLPSLPALPFQGFQSAPHCHSLQSSVFPSMPLPARPGPGSRVAMSFCISATVQLGERHRRQQALKRGVSGMLWFGGHEKCFTPPPYRPALLLGYLWSPVSSSLCRNSLLVGFWGSRSLLNQLRAGPGGMCLVLYIRTWSWLFPTVLGNEAFPEIPR